MAINLTTSMPDSISTQTRCAHLFGSGANSKDRRGKIFGFQRKPFTRTKVFGFKIRTLKSPEDDQTGEFLFRIRQSTCV